MAYVCVIGIIDLSPVLLQLDLCMISLGFPGGSAVRNSPAMQKTWQEPRVQFLVRKDPLEKETQPIPVFSPGKSHGQPMQLKKSQTWLGS